MPTSSTLHKAQRGHEYDGEYNWNLDKYPSFVNAHAAVTTILYYHHIG